MTDKKTPMLKTTAYLGRAAAITLAATGMLLVPVVVLFNELERRLKENERGGHEK